MQRTWRRAWERGNSTRAVFRPAIKDRVQPAATRLAKKLLPSALVAVFLLSSPGIGQATPTGAQVTTGAGTVVQNGSTTTITQATDRLGINWQSFSIAAGERVHFIQPGATSVALNRIVGNSASAIYGSLIANGKVYLINPNGILFAPGSQVNVGGLVASTLNISDENFRNGNYIFTKDGAAGSVINQGTVIAEDHVVFIGPQVKNEGIIAARVSALAAGNKVSLDFNGDKLLNVTVDTGAAGGSAFNSGAITAEGGLVIMSAGTKDALLGTVVNNSGTIKATGIIDANGVIRLEGNTVTNSGTLDASGKGAGQTGGTVKVLGDTVTLAGGSTIDVSGDKGGGTVLVGGNFQGNGPEHNATTTTVASGASIKADAITSGNGGQVVVWANDTTEFKGQISAKGGLNSGDGGNIEVSGKKTLIYKGTVDTTAPKGKTGNLLLDPSDYTIGADASGANYMNVHDLTTMLQTTDVTIQTDAAGIQDGNITVEAAVDYQVGPQRTLSLIAHNDISGNAAISGSNLNLIATAGRNINIHDVISTGSLTFTPGAAGTTNINTSSITTTGSQTYNGAVVLWANTALTTTGAGDITFGSTVDNTGGQGYGLTINSAGSANFSGNVGVTNALGSLSVASTGNTNINTSAIRTTGTQTYNGNVVLGGAGTTAAFTTTNSGITFGNYLIGGTKDLSLSSGTGTVTFNSVDNVGALLVTGPGDVTFNGDVSNTGSLSLSAGGTAYLNGGSITTSGNQTYNKVMVLRTDTALTTGSGNITFGSTVDSTGGQGYGLTVNSAGNANFSGNVGATNALGSLSVASTGNTNINTSAIRTTGTQIYNSAVVLGTDTTLTTTGNGNISFGSTVKSDSSLTQRSLTVNSAGNVSFGGAVGSTNTLVPQLSSLAVTSAGNITFNVGSSITTRGNQTYNGAVIVDGSDLYGVNTTLTTTGVGGNVTFGSTVNSTSSTIYRGGLGVDTCYNGGSVTFNGDVGTTTPLGNLTISGPAGININTSSILTTGSQTYTGPVTLGGAGSSVTFGAPTGMGCGNIIFNNNVIGNGKAFSITGGTYYELRSLSDVSSVTFSNIDAAGYGSKYILGDITSTGSLALNWNGFVHLGRNITAAGDISLGGGLYVFGNNNSTITSTTGNVSLSRAIEVDATDLTINAAGTATLGSTIGVGGPHLYHLTVNAPNININNNITTFGSQTYNGAVTVGGGMLTDSYNGNITFNGTVDGDWLNTGNGGVTFNGAVGGTTGLRGINVTGNANINGGSVRTLGGQYYDGAVTLGANTALTGGMIDFGGTVNGGYALNVNSANRVYFRDAVGNSTRLTSLAVTINPGVGNGTNINGGSITTTGDQTYNGNVSLGANATLTSSAGGITLSPNSQLTTGNYTLLMRAGTDITLGSPILSSVASGNAVTLTAGGRFINNYGANAIQTAGGRWLVYSQNPANDTRGGMLYNFKQYNTAYGGTVLGSGNGFIYTLAPTITVGLTGTTSKTYDGNTAATLTGNNFTTSGEVDNDTVTITSTGATYNNKHAGTGKTVTATGLSVSSASDGNATVYGYQVANAGGSASGAIGTITPMAITVTGAANTKTYDGTTSSATSPTISGGTPVAGEVTVSQVYSDIIVGTGKTLLPSVVINDGNNGNNYTVTLVNSANGVINPAATQSPIYQGALNSVLLPPLSGSGPGSGFSGPGSGLGGPGGGFGGTSGGTGGLVVSGGLGGLGDLGSGLGGSGIFSDGSGGFRIGSGSSGTSGLVLSSGGGFQVAVVASGASSAGIMVLRPIGDVEISGGRMINFTLPADSFAVTSPNTSVTLMAMRPNGAPLPGWISFNPVTGSFQGTPPPGVKSVDIKVTARTDNGATAVQIFKVNITSSRAPDPTRR